MDLDPRFVQSFANVVTSFDRGLADLVASLGEGTPGFATGSTS